MTLWIKSAKYAMKKINLGSMINSDYEVLTFRLGRPGCEGDI